MFVKPASPDLRVPDPSKAGTPAYWLPVEGRDVDGTDFYWARRLRDGDVVESQPPAAAAPAAPAA